MLTNLQPKLLIYQQDDLSILDRVTEPFLNPSDYLSELRDIVRAMDKIMSNSNGIGLAAPQVGLDLRLFIMNIGQGLTAYINPVIIKTVGTFTSREGCLSFPGLLVEIPRAKIVKFKAFDVLQGKEVTVKYRGLESACSQHEIDHLNGITCINVNQL